MRTVIIIDDERDARLTLAQHISLYPGLLIVAECERGPEAVEKINSLMPDIIFLDMQLPGFDGFGVIQRLIHRPQIIITTAFPGYALKAFDHDVVDYLQKPFSSVRFITAVTKAIYLLPKEDMSIPAQEKDDICE